jgi:hypothetical protein
MFREAVLAFLGAGVGAHSVRPPRRNAQPLGGHCAGADLPECRAVFGDGLAGVCATCPN